MNREEEHKLILLRQSKIAELLAQGYTSQSEIARRLDVSEPTVSRDIQFISRQAQENLRFHVERRIPFEIEKCYTGLNLVLRKAFDITDQEDANFSVFKLNEKRLFPMSRYFNFGRVIED